MKLVNLETNENGVKWIELTGTDYGTGIEFNKEVFGITADDRIIDCDGIPCTECDNTTQSVRNSIQ